MRIFLKQFTKFPNAGDAASSHIVARLLRAQLLLCDDKELDCPNLIGIGSILHWADRHSIVWGSGFISSTSTLRQPPASILAVRGHLTRERLNQMGIPSPLTVGDPGILISDIFQPTARARQGIGVVPHYVDIEHPFVSQALARGAALIDPLSPLEEYITALVSCETIISSSLHGIVFAHSFGIPAVWIKLSSRVIGDGFKFFDYYTSIGFGVDQVPVITGVDAFDRVVDAAGLPKVQIDRSALQGGLLAAAPNLGVGHQC